jgi:hypothetical protein
MAQESIPLAYVAWRACTTTLFLLGSFLAPIDFSKIPAQSRKGRRTYIKKTRRTVRTCQRGSNFYFFPTPNIFSYARLQRDRRVEWRLSGLAHSLRRSVQYTPTPFVRIDHCCCCFSRFLGEETKCSELLTAY